MSELAHAEFMKIHTAENAVGQRASRTIGVVQPSCITPDRQRQISWRKGQGGVVTDGALFPGSGLEGVGCVEGAVM